MLLYGRRIECLCVDILPIYRRGGYQPPAINKRLCQGKNLEAHSEDAPTLLPNGAFDMCGFIGIVNCDLTLVVILAYMKKYTPIKNTFDRGVLYLKLLFA